jgi:hypothetical protein
MRARTILLPVAGLSLAVLGGVLSAHTSGIVVPPSHAGETQIAVSVHQAALPVTTTVGTGSAESRTVKVGAAPTGTITYPVDGTTYGAAWTGTITGTASSAAGATVTGTQVAVEDTTASQWWSGSSFSASSQTFVGVTGTTTWLLPLGTGNLTSGDSYSVVAQATDSAGKLGTSSTISFTYIIPTAPPAVVVAYPVDGTAYGTNWTGTITGTASPNSGPGATITSTKVAIEDTTTKQWWSGTSFSVSGQTFVPVSGTTTWYLPIGPNSLTSDDTYSVTAEATDSLGKVGTNSTVTFTYTSQPTVSITFPVNRTRYGTDWTTMITGGASAGVGTTIRTTEVAIEDTTTNQWWNGTSFAGSTQTFMAVTGTTTWYLPLEPDSLTLGDSYTIVAQATDSAGNVSASSTVTFTYVPQPTHTAS